MATGIGCAALTALRRMRKKCPDRNDRPLWVKEMKKMRWKDDMKHVRIAGLCLASMLVLSMALAGSATAAPLWLLCLEGANSSNTKYEDNQCSKAAAGGKWEQVGLASGKSATVRFSVFSLRFVDEAKEGEALAVKCDGGSKGSAVIEGPNKGVIREAFIEKPKENCVRQEGVCKAGEVEAVQGADLPWKVELFETESKARTKLAADGSGEPGWTLKCNTSLGKIEDTCKGEGGKEEQANLETRDTSDIRLAAIITLRVGLYACLLGHIGAVGAWIEGVILAVGGAGFYINNK